MPDFLDDKDRAILNAIQSDFPVCPEPFRQIAEQLQMSTDDVLERIRRLKETGIIRRIGANIAPEKLNYVSTLCAASVPKEKIDVFTKTVNTYPGVTHNYIRDDKLNVWFTFIASSKEKIETSLEEISQITGIRPILNLPATRVFKISAKFNV